MELVSFLGRTALPAVAVLGLMLTGCGSGGQGDAVPSASDPPMDAAAYSAQRDWCLEHGVPESKCGRCDSKLAAAFQKDGDWCEEHGRPESQCFLCTPEAQAKFAAQYEAKFGEPPPPPEPEI